MSRRQTSAKSLFRCADRVAQDRFDIGWRNLRCHWGEIDLVVPTVHDQTLTHHQSIDGRERLGFPVVRTTVQGSDAKALGERDQCHTRGGPAQLLDQAINHPCADWIRNPHKQLPAPLLARDVERGALILNPPKALERGNHEGRTVLNEISNPADNGIECALMASR